jgi:hemerythrin-like metal-binding protein
MSGFDFTPDLSVGIPEIDAQHWEIIRLLDKLDALNGNAEHSDTFPHILNDLVQRIASHFATEERYFHQYAYEDSEPHRIEHARLLAELRKLQEELDAGQRTGSKVARYLRVWLTTHVLVEDRAYAEFFRVADGRREPLRRRIENPII